MRLKELRKENKKTQLEIAEFLNTTSQSYGRYELEISEPTIETLCKLADYYQVSLDYLLGRPFFDEYQHLQPEAKTLLQIYDSLDLTSKKLLLEVARNFNKHC